MMRIAVLLACSVSLLGACGAGDADPAKALAQRGYSLTPASLCKAMGQGDVTALQLAAKAGQAPRSLLIDGDRLCVESALVGKSGKVDVAAILGAVDPPAAELQRTYASGIGMTARDVPQADTLARAAGHTGQNFYVGGKVIEATPLMLAVWANDAAAVQSLLERGADPNVPSKIPLQVQGGESSAAAHSVAPNALIHISATPLFEAYRLQRQSVAKLLAQRGAKAHIASQKPQV
jgi:hypothetical protein